MRRRLRAGSAKPRHRKATAAKRPSRVEGTRGVTSSAPKEESEIARLRRQLSEARRRHRRAKQALRESDPRIRRLVDANIIGIFMWDFDGRILEANEAFLRIVGYEHEDLVAGRIRWMDLTPPEWRERDSRLIQEQRATGILPPFEKEYIRKDGSRVPVLIGVATFEEGDNRGVAFVLDLTQRKRAEDALRESERKYRQLIESVPCHFWSVRPDREPTYVNQRLLDYFGIRFGDKKIDNSVLHPDDVAETERALRACP
jgi:PAS domain S-box-containing protein